MDIKTINCIGKSVLYFNDLHCPFHHKKMINFLAAIKKSHKPDIVICGGDEVDAHSLSFHDSNPDIEVSASGELKAAIKVLKRIEILFPKMYVLDSNHGSLVYRRAKANGVPRHYLKSLGEIYGTPNWSWHEDLILETKKGKIYTCHGKTTAYGKLALTMGMSAIQSHFHNKFEITYHRSASQIIFNAFGGCLADDTSRAMEYGRNFVNKPIHGCLFIDKSGTPHMIRLT